MQPLSGNPSDLLLEREVPVAVEHLWRGWTDERVITKWFTPKPWVTTEAEIDLRPGGVFRTVMKGPDGEVNEAAGCVLEVVPLRRFVWTSALGPGFVPVESAPDGFLFTAIIEMEPVTAGALYRATARHSNVADASAHADMGFHAGWEAALDQLVALAD